MDVNVESVNETVSVSGRVNRAERDCVWMMEDKEQLVKEMGVEDEEVGVVSVANEMRERVGWDSVK